MARKLQLSSRALTSVENRPARSQRPPAARALRVSLSSLRILYTLARRLSPGLQIRCRALSHAVVDVDCPTDPEGLPAPASAGVRRFTCARTPGTAPCIPTVKASMIAWLPCNRCQQLSCVSVPDSLCRGNSRVAGACCRGLRPEAGLRVLEQVQSSRSVGASLSSTPSTSSNELAPACR